MSVQVAAIDLSAATVGATGTIPATGALPVAPAPIAQQMRPNEGMRPHLVIYNESGCQLLLALPVTNQTKTLPAGRWIDIALPANEVQVSYRVLAVAGGAPFSTLLADYYAPGEPVEPLGVVGNSPIGGSLTNITASAVVNNGGANPVYVVQSAIDSAGQFNLAEKNNGTFVVRTGFGANPTIGTGVPVIAIVAEKDSEGALTGPVIQFGASTASNFRPLAPIPLFTGVYQVLATAAGGLAGQVNGGVTFGQTGALGAGTPPDATTGALFNGTTGNIVTPYSTALPTGNAAWTLECLLNYSANPAATDVALSIGSFAAAHQGVYLGQTNAGKLEFSAAGALGTIDSAAALSTNAYHHCAVTWDGTTATLYLDGASQGTSTPGAMTIVASGLTIGSTPGGSFFSGILQDCALYGTALSAARITAHSNAVAAGGYAAAVLNDSPLRYYRLGDPLGQTWAADTTAQTVTGLVNAGGGFATVGGVATVGGLGAPVVVAQSLRQLVTSTALVNVFSYTPPVTGLYRISPALTANNGGAATITLSVRWTDPIGPTVSDQRFFGNGVVLSAAGFPLGVLPFNVLPVSVWAQAGTAIIVEYTDSTNTPSDTVSVLIERLA